MNHAVREAAGKRRAAPFAGAARENKITLLKMTHFVRRVYNTPFSYFQPRRFAA